MGKFDNLMIGKVDCNDVQLKCGDSIKIEVAKPSINSVNGVYHKGIIIYSYLELAFCIKLENGEEIPLCNYAKYCKIEKQ